ncbi:glycerol-1-phosphate dehydrogenase [NAD(P)+] [Hydrogenispora ethanolica]|uniref:Glycerol-1-phosphate dehydrogenase [NAD(P)+] n=1 Tax=Hydrogenispora ethanolica TaxID=1082276 RepID=A0A4R1RTW6_HYDET|nr:sn-glycerol-1-phosphate dehydrogenase [Hydrogenispora ethanolica]TCL69886.1 glycerol-1-phosphate dehydrogenase [NAD(P)+] [Hydrogenispora ethanolica]
METLIQTIVECGALRKLPGVLAGHTGEILLVADDRTHGVAGEQVLAKLKAVGFTVRECVLRRETSLVPDENALAEITQKVGADTGLLIALGAGTITDLTRFVSSRAGKPFVAIPTAPSMDGYASPVAVLTLNGFKQTLPAAPPIAIVADPEIMATAPAIMIQAGFGDLLGKYTALADWKLDQLVNGEAFSDEIEAIVRTAIDKAVESFEGESAPLTRIRNLTEALIISGIAMLKWGDSRPASGAEHHLSHFWEMQDALQGAEGHLHGTKVGIATILVCRYYQQLFALSQAAVAERIAARQNEPEPVYRQRIAAVFGPLAPSVLHDLKDFYRDSEKRSARQRRLLDHWPTLQDWVGRNVAPPERIISLLNQAGAPTAIEFLEVTQEGLRTALENAKEVRLRYTVFRLAEDIGWQIG